MVDGRPVSISTEALTLDDVVKVSQGAPVELTDDATERMAASRRVVDDAIARGDAIYGVTTGVGHARDERLPADALRALQPVLVGMHVGGLGDPLPTERVRAGLVVRLNGFARGGSGVSVGVAQGVAALLNHGIHPIIPARGSVGAGDLGQLAFVGRVLLGHGEVEVGGERMGAGRALEAAGLAPVTLEPKDALAIMSSNALSIGHGALTVTRLRSLLALGDLVVATSMEAMQANPSIVDAAVAAARHSAGQETTSEAIRRALAGSVRTGPDADLSVQDPLSYRVVPQVHGACRDLLAFSASALGDELNAAADNPLVDLGSGRVISNGNFHAMNVALAAEALRIAVAHVGLLSERRMGHLWDAAISSFGSPGTGGDGPPLEDTAPPALAGLGLRYPAAASYTRLRHLAHPVTLDVPSLDLAVEDHAPNTAEAITMLDVAAGILEELFVVEALIGLALLGPGADRDDLGEGTRRFVGTIDDVLTRVPNGALPHEVHGSVAEVLRRLH